MMEAELRANALAHAEECAACGVRLADERALSFSLRALASSVETMQAPVQLETTLREAFRQREATVAPAPLIASTQTRARRWAAWATAAAAAIVTVFAIQAFRLREPTAPLLKAKNGMSLSGMTASLPARASVKPAGELALVNDESPAQTRVPRSALGRQVFNTRNMMASNRNRPAQPSNAEPEIVTDFMPLTYGAALNPNEGGQLVRVELPRSALASLGLPVNVERSEERVKADVLLGHDGLARAIRFVR